MADGIGMPPSGGAVDGDGDSGGDGGGAVAADVPACTAKQKGVTKKRMRARGGSAPTSKQIRNLQRQLERFGDTMPPGVKRRKEEELDGLRALSAERTRRQAEARNVQKYRMVKFFDRRKIERKLNSTDPEVRKQAQRDMRYVREYPRDQKYVALFPKNGHTEKSLAQVERMRALIEGGADVGADARAGGATDENDEMNEVDESHAEADDFFLPG